MTEKYHLYLMQNHLGLIKIGKAVDVERRRQHLARADECDIRTVHVLNNGGDQEQLYHALLRRRRLYGEWFDGDEGTRKAIRGLFDLQTDFAWPFSLASLNAVNAWLDQLERIRTRISREKRSQRVIRGMENRSSPDTWWHLNWKIWQIIWEYEQEGDPSIWHDEDADGRSVIWVTRDSDTTPEPLPFFTTDLRSALLVWPEDCRPDVWPGDAWSCCIAGLKARRGAMAGDRRARGLTSCVQP
jgi:hypothetical protein